MFRQDADALALVLTILCQTCVCVYVCKYTGRAPSDDQRREMLSVTAVCSAIDTGLSTPCPAQGAATLWTEEATCLREAFVHNPSLATLRPYYIQWKNMLQQPCPPVFRACFGWTGGLVTRGEAGLPVCAWIECAKWETLNLQLFEGAQQLLDATRAALHEHPAPDVLAQLFAEAAETFLRSGETCSSWKNLRSTQVPLPIETSVELHRALESLARALHHAIDLIHTTCEAALGSVEEAPAEGQRSGEWRYVASLLVPADMLEIGALSRPMTDLRCLALRRACMHGAVHAFQNARFGDALALEQCRAELLEKSLEALPFLFAGRGTEPPRSGRIWSFLPSIMGQEPPSSGTAQAAVAGALAEERARVADKVRTLRITLASVRDGTDPPQFDESMLPPSSIPIRSNRQALLEVKPMTLAPR